MKFIKHELAIMQCLWKRAPISCAEILQCANLDIQEKALYKIVGNMQKKDFIHIAEARQGTRKPIQLYAPSITELDCMESTIRTNPIFRDAMITPLFQRFIGSVKKQETLDELQVILDKARREMP